MFHEVKDVTGGKKICSIIFIIIESGMALFAIQLARLVIAATEERTNAECNIYLLSTLWLYPQNAQCSYIISHCYFIFY
jgi:hypothetical protein